MNTATTTATISDTPPPAECDGSLNISRARWNANNNRLQVRGDGGQRDGGDFVLTNAYDSSQILAEGSTGRDRSFNFAVRNPSPVPCAVRVEQTETGRCAIADVDDAPADCAPPPPGGGDGVTAHGDLYATPVGDTLAVTASRLSGVLYNDFGGVGQLTAQLVSGPAAGCVARIIAVRAPRADRNRAPVKAC